MTVSFLVLPIEFSFFDTFFFCTHFKGDQLRSDLFFLWQEVVFLFTYRGLKGIQQLWLKFRHAHNPRSRVSASISYLDSPEEQGIE